MVPRRIVWVLVLAVASCSAPPRGIRRLPDAYAISATDAQAATAAGDHELAASSWYEIYLRDDADGARAALGVAESLLAQGLLRSPREFLEEAMVRHPDRPELLELHANVLALAGFRRAAESEYARAIDLDPDRLTALQALARVRLELGLRSAAATLLERCIALGADDLETWCLLASAKRGQGAVGEAFALYERIFARFQVDALRLAHAASAFYELERGERTELRAQVAESWLRRAIELAPNLPEPYIALGGLRDARGQREPALACYQAALAVAPADARAAALVARALVAASDVAGARRVLADAIEVQSSSETRAELRRRLEELDVQPATP
jgi:tetratricopeptide (TPR) repeat protein